MFNANVNKDLSKYEQFDRLTEWVCSFINNCRKQSIRNKSDSLKEVNVDEKKLVGVNQEE